MYNQMKKCFYIVFYVMVRILKFILFYFFEEETERNKNT